jgi:hypothetical protein
VRGGHADRYEFSLRVARYDVAMDTSRLHAALPEFGQSVPLEEGLRRAWRALGASSLCYEYDDFLSRLLVSQATPV